MQTIVLLGNIRGLWKTQPMHLCLQAVHAGSLCPSALHLLRAKWISLLEFTGHTTCWGSEKRDFYGHLQFLQLWGELLRPFLHFSWWLFPLSVLVPGRHGHLESTLSANEQVCCWLSIQPSSWGPGMGLLLDRQSLPTSYCPQEHVSVLGIFSSLSVGFSLMMLDAAVLLCVGF